MKKLLALALSLAMVLSLAACGSKTEEPKQDDSSADNNPPPKRLCISCSVTTICPASP